MMLLLCLSPNGKRSSRRIKVVFALGQVMQKQVRTLKWSLLDTEILRPTFNVAQMKTFRIL